MFVCLVGVVSGFWKCYIFQQQYWECGISCSEFMVPYPIGLVKITERGIRVRRKIFLNELEENNCQSYSQQVCCFHPERHIGRRVNLFWL